MARRKRGASEVTGVTTQWRCARCKRYAVPDANFTQIDPRYTVGVCASCGRAALVMSDPVSPLRGGANASA